MPEFRRAFPLESDGPNRVMITWQGNFFYPDHDIRVYLDDQLLGTLPDRAALRTGKSFRLPDGQPLRVRLERNSLVVLLGSRSLGDLEHPRKELRQTANMYAWITALNLLLPAFEWLVGRLPTAGSPWALAGVILLAGIYALLFRLGRQEHTAAFVLGGMLVLPNAGLLYLALGNTSLGLILISLLVGLRSLEAARTAYSLRQTEQPG